MDNLERGWKHQGCDFWDKRCDCLVKANESRTLYSTIRKRPALLFGHIMCRVALENIVTTGTISGRRGSYGRNTARWPGMVAGGILIELILNMYWKLWMPFYRTHYKFCLTNSLWRSSALPAVVQWCIPLWTFDIVHSFPLTRINITALGMYLLGIIALGTYLYICQQMSRV